MNRTLFLLRHSYAEKTDDKSDRDRMLTVKGLNAVRAFGRKLQEDEFDPDTIVCSPAVRTRETAVNLIEELGISEQLISFDEKIYGASVRELLGVVNEIGPSVKTVLLIGHNPAITFFAEYLTGAGIENIRPCGLVTIRFKKTGWTRISQSTGIFVSYYHPTR